MTVSGECNSNRIKADKAVPTIEENMPNIIYNVPISLWLVDHNHRVFMCIIISYIVKNIKNKVRVGNVIIFLFLVRLISDFLFSNKILFASNER
jgi:hypothetical protein